MLQAESATYKAPSAEREVWWDLAKAAITLGTGIVATYLGGAVSTALLSAAEVAGAGALEKVISNAVRDALKQVAAAALDAVHSKPNDGSSNTSVAFLKAQLDTLDNMETGNARIAEDIYKQHFLLLYSNPDVAIATMQAVEQSFSRSAETAEAAQLSASAGAWLAFKARMVAGVAAIGSDHSAEYAVTNLSKAARTSIAGVLEIRANIDLGKPRVNDARVDGVAQAVADHLGGLDLRAARIPLKVVAGWNEPNPTIIMRDEDGHVTVAGDLMRLAAVSSDREPTTGAAQADLAARSLLDLVTSRTLSGWGVSVSTDDRSAKEGK